MANTESAGGAGGAAVGLVRRRIRKVASDIVGKSRSGAFLTDPDGPPVSAMVPSPGAKPLTNLPSSSSEEEEEEERDCCCASNSDVDSSSASCSQLSEGSKATTTTTAARRRRTAGSLIGHHPRNVNSTVNALSLLSLRNTRVGRRRNKRKWRDAYDPPPLIDQSTILGFGLFVFALAQVWPPLVLLVAYVLSKLIPYSFRVNDEASVRRQLFSEFHLDAVVGGNEGDDDCDDDDDDDCDDDGDDGADGNDQQDGKGKRGGYYPENFRTIPPHIKLEESFWINSRGMNLCTVTMTPTHTDVKAVVCFCHGYCDNASYYKMIEYQRLVERGIAFVAIEYEGHGRSDGPLALIADWERMIDDVSTYFAQAVRERFQPDTPTFLVGESMGGAVAYSVYNRMPNLFKGVVFICPMCKIADDMLPPEWVIEVMKWLTGPRGSTSWIGYLPIAPARNDLKNLTYRDPRKAKSVWRCPTSFCRNPRLATARELVEVTRKISGSLSDFDAPFLVLHGKADRVTDPKLSQLLYEESKSKDKSIRLYDDMWHALTCGEPDENIDIVFNDCIEWILHRAT